MKLCINLLSLLLLFIVVSCNNNNNTIAQDDKGREDFQQFYDKFGSDSSFQMQRIEFPMLGKNPDGSAERFFWTEENWILQKSSQLDNEDIKLEPIVDMGDLMRVRIVIQERFMIENLFSLINNRWFLTEYSGIHDIEYFRNGKKELPAQ